MCPPGTKTPKDVKMIKFERIRCTAMNLIKDHANPSIPAMMRDISPYRPRGNFQNRIKELLGWESSYI